MIRSFCAGSTNQYRGAVRPAVMRSAVVGTLMVPGSDLEIPSSGGTRRTAASAAPASTASLERAVGRHDRMDRRPREVLVRARAGVWSASPIPSTNRHARRRPLGKPMPCRQDLALDADPVAAGTSGGDHKVLALRAICGPTDTGPRSGRRQSPPGRTMAAVPCAGEQQVANKDAAARCS